ncbi:hypothetical protein B566_EDAN015103 [Ephemera danica]|nr:hypothetical protein B566_EDAN015103 [Ephemera danica]
MVVLCYTDLHSHLNWVNQCSLQSRHVYGGMHAPSCWIENQRAQKRRTHHPYSTSRSRQAPPKEEGKKKGSPFVLQNLYHDFLSRPRRDKTGRKHHVKCSVYV